MGLSPPHPLATHPWLGFATPASMLSVWSSRPNCGVPQMRKLSSVCIGPCIQSPVTKTISVQLELRDGRVTVQWFWVAAQPAWPTLLPGG